MRHAAWVLVIAAAAASALPARAQTAIELVDFEPPKHLVADGTSSFKVPARIAGLERDYDVRLAGTSKAYRGEEVWTVTDTATNDKTTTFTVVPSATAAYRVEAWSGDELVAASRRFTVVAHPAVTLTSKKVGGGLTLQTTARLDRGDLTFKPRAGGAKEAAFYYRLDGSDVYKRLATAPLEKQKCCARTASHTIYDLALLSGIRSFRVCFPGRVFAGAGEPARCPLKLSAG
jgi:hypothetical protein